MRITKQEIDSKDAAIRDLNSYKNEAMQEIARLKAELEKITKDRDNHVGYYNTANKQRSEVEAELEQIHALLDVFQGALPRESDEKESFRRVRYSAMTRLASWLANRGTLSVSVAPRQVE